MARIMSTAEVCTAEDIGEGATFTSNALYIGKADTFSLHVPALTGTTIDGITVTYSVSTAEDGTFIVPAGASAIFTTLKVAGAAAFTPVPAPWIKFIVLNTDASHHVVPTIKLVVQEDAF